MLDNVSLLFIHCRPAQLVPHQPWKAAQQGLSKNSYFAAYLEKSKEAPEKIAVHSTWATFGSARKKAFYLCLFIPHLSLQWRPKEFYIKLACFFPVPTQKPFFIPREAAVETFLGVLSGAVFLSFHGWV